MPSWPVLRLYGPWLMPRMYCSLVDLLYSPYPPCLFGRSHVRRQVPPCPHRSERWNCVGENWPVILPEIATSTSIQGSFTCRKSAKWELPFRRKACWEFFRPEKSWRLRPGLNPRTWVLKGSTLTLDHRHRFMTCYRVTFTLALIFLYHCGLQGNRSVSELPLSSS